MMLKEKSQSKVRTLFLAPVVALCMLFVNNPVVASTLSSVSAISVTNEESSTNVCKMPDKMPEFPGGTKGLMNFLATNVKYPQVAVNNKTEGRVLVQFVVDKNGKVTKPKVVKSVSKELDEEAMRVVALLPDFIPGEKDGKKVPVFFTLPISFKLNK